MLVPNLTAVIQENLRAIVNVDKIYNITFFLKLSSLSIYPITNGIWAPKNLIPLSNTDIQTCHITVLLIFNENISNEELFFLAKKKQAIEKEIEVLSAFERNNKTAHQVTLLFLTEICGRKKFGRGIVSSADLYYNGVGDANG